MICWDRFLKCRSTIDRINYPYWRFLDALSHNRYKEIRHIGFCIERAFKITGVTEKDPAFYDRIQKFGLGSFGCVPLFLITRVGARVLCSIVYGLIELPLPPQSTSKKLTSCRCPNYESSIRIFEDFSWSLNGQDEKDGYGMAT